MQIKITILDGFTANPGDLSWVALEEVGEVTVYDRTRAEDVVTRAKDADIVLTNKDGKTQDMKTFKKLVMNGVTDLAGEYGDVDRDRMYALIEGGKDFVLIQNYVFDKVLHDVRYFMTGNPIKGNMGYFEEIK